MTKNRDVEYVDQIIEAARIACSFAKGMDRQAFHEDKRTHQAVILNIAIIGEATTRLQKEHPELLALHPEVPWKSMRGMRNRIAHGYSIWISMSSGIRSTAACLP